MSLWPGYAREVLVIATCGLYNINILQPSIIILSDACIVNILNECKCHL
jgi:hypothetical protein